jgi:VCBS repeat-containing protein
VSDIDHGQAYVQAQSNVNGAYGTFSIASDGNWTYNLNNSASNVQALAASQTVSDSFAVTSADGSASQQISVNIGGANDAPVAANDTISGGKLTFENGTYTTPAYGNSLITGDYSFTGSNMYVTSYYGADNTNCIYTYSYNGYYYGNGATQPITMTKTNGGSFTLESANVTSYNYGYSQYDTETITGYLHGVQVASQSFNVPDIANGGSHTNTLTLTDPGFSAVDQVVFNLSGGSQYYLYQWIDNIVTPNTVTVARDVDVLFNDTDIDSGAHLSVANFSGFSAHGAAISLNANGTLHYDPTASAELQAVSQGTNVYDTFTYQSQDEYGVLSNTATVSVTVVGAHA